MRHSRAALLEIPTRVSFIELTHYGLETTPRDMARFGLMVLRKGRWKSEQIVPKAYLERAKAVTTNGYSHVTSEPDHLVTQYHYDDIPLVMAEGCWAMTDGFPFSMHFTVTKATESTLLLWH